MTGDGVTGDGATGVDDRIEPAGAAPPPERRRSLRTRAAIVVLVVIVGVVVLAVSGFEDTVTYYRTPTEVAQQPPAPNERFRVAGMVVRGSVDETSDGIRFRLTDGATDLSVVSTDTPPSAFRAGQGAVVEGVLSAPGVFDADRVLVRHSNEYRAPGDK